MTTNHEKSHKSARRLRRALLGTMLVLGVLSVVAVSVRAAVAEVFYIPTNVAAPEVPKGARVLVYKLSSKYEPGQVVVYKFDGMTRIARVAVVNADGRITLAPNGSQPHSVSVSDVLGRVVVNTR